MSKRSALLPVLLLVLFYPLEIKSDLTTPLHWTIQFGKNTNLQTPPLLFPFSRPGRVGVYPEISEEIGEEIAEEHGDEIPPWLQNDHGYFLYPVGLISGAGRR